MEETAGGAQVNFTPPAVGGEMGRQKAELRCPLLAAWFVRVAVCALEVGGEPYPTNVRETWPANTDTEQNPAF